MFIVPFERSIRNTISLRLDFVPESTNSTGVRQLTARVLDIMEVKSEWVPRLEEAVEGMMRRKQH